MATIRQSKSVPAVLFFFFTADLAARDTRCAYRLVFALVCFCDSSASQGVIYAARAARSAEL